MRAPSSEREREMIKAVGVVENDKKNQHCCFFQLLILFYDLFQHQ